MPGLGGEVADRAELDDARDVQQRVEAVGHGLLPEGPGEPVGVAEVADERAGTGVEGGQFLGASGVPGQQHEVVAALQEAARDGRADTGAGCR